MSNPFSNVQTLKELDKMWRDHIDSLRMSGMEFNERALVEEWNQARWDFIEGF